MIYLEVVKFQREVDDLSELVEQTLLWLEMLARRHVIRAQHTQQVRNRPLCRSDNDT